MIRKTILTVILLTLLMFTAIVSAEEGNLVKNPGFEEVEGENPVYWKTYCFDTSGITEFKVESGSAHTGQNCLVIINRKPNDSKAEQVIPVEKGRTYKIGCRIRTENIKQQAGSANITLLQEDAIFTSVEYMDTGGQWKDLVFYIKVLEDRKPEFNLILRLGGQGTVNSGTAYFDDVYVVPVDESEAVGISRFHIPEKSSKGSSSDTSSKGSTSGNAPKSSGTGKGNGNLVYVLAGVVVLAAIILIELKFSRKAGNRTGDFNLEENGEPDKRPGKTDDYRESD